MPDSYSATGAPVKTHKKLIEVALPLEAINLASVREKSIRHGHPSTLHLWWARRPLAAARAVIFSQMVDDPSEYVDVLRDDPRLRRKADSILKARMKTWEEATALVEKAKGTGLDVPEPGPMPTLDEILADQERQRLFRIIEDLVQWENTTNVSILQAARDEIWASWRRASLDNVDHPLAKALFDRHKLPAFHDPFAGGGAIPLEAQRLGLESYASDLNPIPVLINKAMIEIPPRFAGRPPVNPESRAKSGHSGAWKGSAGLAEDVRYYGQWMRDEAERRIGHLYPKVVVTAEMTVERPDLKPYVGRSLTVTAWIWARTVKSPNPAFAHVDVPLASSFILSTKPGKEAFIEPSVHADSYQFKVRAGRPASAGSAANGTKLSRGANFQCVLSGAVINEAYIKAESMAGRMGSRLMAIVAEGAPGRIYLAPTQQQVEAAESALPAWRPDEAMNRETTNLVSGRGYGFFTWSDLFTSRQLVALTTFSDLVEEVRAFVRRHAISSGTAEDGVALRDGGDGALAYSEAVSVYLSFLISQVANHSATVCGWNAVNAQMRSVFARQAIPMVWDYAESNPLSDTSGSYNNLFERQVKGFAALGVGPQGHGFQADALQQSVSDSKVVSTDPPYYDNIAYADLSDFFYVWQRHSLRTVFPDLFATVAVPKAEELVAVAYRHGSKAGAEAFFLEGMTQAIGRIAHQAHPVFPITIYYAFKQSETEEAAGGQTVSTGWDTFLGAVMDAGLSVVGTWPIRTEKLGRVIGIDAAALASSIVLVCRRTEPGASVATRREFLSALKTELPGALADLQRGNIAPVDLAQAAIGPGMAVFTRYAKVIDAQGTPLKVRDALALINAALDEALAAQEGNFDVDSRFALAWFEQQGFVDGLYGMADVLARAKNTSVAGMVEAGILESKQGKVRLLKPSELDPDWDPAKDHRRPAWQAVHQLIQAADRGEAALAELIRKLGPEADIARELAYRLYVLSERKKRTTEALWYNGLVQSWTEAVRLAADAPTARPVQGELFGEG